MHILINMKLFFTLLLFILGTVCRAADISFVVYQSKGMVTKTSSKVLLKKGDQLFVHEMLAVGEQSNVILICSNYKIIQITKINSGSGEQRKTVVLSRRVELLRMERLDV